MQETEEFLKKGKIPDSALYLAQEKNTGTLFYCAQDNGFDITLYPVNPESTLSRMIIVSRHIFPERFEKKEIKKKIKLITK